jgi:UDP-2,4-diacetamido-2,4,6-trideoxy-beta-L-altropyranose hydrolase
VNLYFRVDASVMIGTGHVMRCLALAVQLKRRSVNVIFICRDYPGNLCYKIESHGFEVILLKSPNTVNLIGVLGSDNLFGVTQVQDAQETLLHLKKAGGCDWLIVDHYGLDELWEMHVRLYAKKIMVIDDLADRKHVCEILLDQNFHSQNELRYVDKISKNCTKLLGPKYAILRPEFLNIRKIIKEKKTENTRILIFFGGSDSGNETLKALKAIKLIKRSDIFVEVIFGANYLFKKQTLSFASKMLNVTCYDFIIDIANLMNRADLYLGAAGVTTWERCCLGLPSIVIAVANNQIEPMRQMNEVGVVSYLGEASKVKEKDIVRAVCSLIADPILMYSMRQKAMQLVDGKGANRCALAIMNYGANDGKKI